MIEYKWERLTSREFEIIACNFANDMFPAYKWQLTTSTRDDNHDFYAKAGNWDKWGEAKHSKKHNKTISRSQWDPTLVSAKLINSVNDILLVTSAFIPLSYVIRSYQMTAKPIANIYCINRLILNEWYSKTHRQLSTFNMNVNITTILDKIEKKPFDFAYNSEIKLFFFDDVTQNHLTIIKSFVPNNVYKVNIALFVHEEKAKFQIDLGKSFAITSDISLKNLSYLNKKSKISNLTENSFKCNVYQGYSIIEFQIIIKEITDYQKDYNIIYELNNLKGVFPVIIEYQQIYNMDSLINIEKKIVENISKQNRILRTCYVAPYLYNRPNFEFLYIHFDERYYNNSTLLCRLLSHMVTGVDYFELDEILLKDNLYLCDYPEYFENIILGIFNDSLSNDFLNYAIDKFENLFLLYENSKNTIYIIENSNILEDVQKEILEKIQTIFSTYKNNDFMIFQDRKRKLVNNCLDDETALIGIIDTGIQSESFGSNLLSIENKPIIMDIDESLYFPSVNLNIQDIKSYVLAKKPKDLEIFLEKIIEIVSKQISSSRVLDFILLLEHSISSKLYFKTIRQLRDIYYIRTDFAMAHQYSKILHQDKNVVLEQYIDDKYKEADELNHCGSIVESRKIFKGVAEKILTRKDTIFLNRGLEALTEVFNINFWLLDVNDLIQEIDNTINTYFFDDLSTVSEEREFYPYYNCLNRKMVTQYLLGQYEDAEKTYKTNLNIVKLNNYRAFAYMDSARGLYYKDINTAYERIMKAFELLECLSKEKKELRRYYDCLIEKSYIEFILATQKDRHLCIKKLVNAVFNVRKYGFKNITKKSYFKLAACFLVLGDEEKSLYYLEKIRSDPYFSEAPRNQFMYNELMKGYYHLINYNFQLHIKNKIDYCNIEGSIEFNCYENKKSNNYFIETRMW